MVRRVQAVEREDEHVGQYLAGGEHCGSERDAPARELEEGVEGLVHVSEMSWSKKVKNPSKLVSPGDHVEAIVSDVNPDARRISLSLKDTLPDPWESVLQK